MSAIFHIAEPEAWAAAQTAGQYRAASLADEGFIHLSTRAQLPATAARFYSGRADLVLLAVDPARLTAPLRYEEGEPGQRFPHLYGPLNLDAVLAAYPFAPQADGSFALPPGA